MYIKLFVNVAVSHWSDPWNNPGKRTPWLFCCRMIWVPLLPPPASGYSYKYPINREKKD